MIHRRKNENIVELIEKYSIHAFLVTLDINSEKMLRFDNIHINNNSVIRLLYIFNN